LGLTRSPSLIDTFLTNHPNKLVPTVVLQKLSVKERQAGQLYEVVEDLADGAKI
jgi:hypothetical protein